MTEADDQFDDPALRSAVARAAGREAAPPELRRKVEALFAGAATAAAATGAGATAKASAGSTSPTTSDTAASRPAAPARDRFGADAPFKLIAAAAMVLLAVGLMVVQIRSEFFPPLPQRAAADSASFPATLGQMLVRSHDQCGKLADHHLVPGDDFAALRVSLAAQGGVSVFADAIGDGWTFKGAGLCRVDQHKTAHLLFARGGEVISVFSLPPPPLCSSGGATYEELRDHHALAGFVHGGALYCVVGSRASGDMAQSQLQPVVAKVRLAMGAGSCRASSPAEMLVRATP